MTQAAEIERLAMAAETAEAQTNEIRPTRDAYTLAQFERLLTEGNEATSQIVRTELYCESITPVNVRETTPPDPVLASLMDGDGRVGGAECRWGPEARSEDFLLVVPSELAEEFARMPEVEVNFVRYRRVPASVEWLGRSEALSLRIAGVLRDIPA
jgi:hypothetical protein